MTPLITPDYMTPQPQPKPSDELPPSVARCPKTNCDVTVPLHYFDGEWFYCPACGVPHRVRIDKEGKRRLSCL